VLLFRTCSDFQDFVRGGSLVPIAHNSKGFRMSLFHEQQRAAKTPVGVVASSKSKIKHKWNWMYNASQNWNASQDWNHTWYKIGTPHTSPNWNGAHCYVPQEIEWSNTTPTHE
jgi:hypothetical protein